MLACGVVLLKELQQSVVQIMTGQQLRASMKCFPPLGAGLLETREEFMGSRVLRSFSYFHYVEVMAYYSFKGCTLAP